MLDSAHTRTGHEAPWTSKLAAGDVLSFPYPCLNPDYPSKTMPCLVYRIQTLGDHTYALMSYGTSSLHDYPKSVSVIDPDEMAAAGVEKTTHFITARRVLVSLTHPDLVARGPDAVIGTLTGRARAKLELVLAHAAHYDGRRRIFSIYNGQEAAE